MILCSFRTGLAEAGGESVSCSLSIGVEGSGLFEFTGDLVECEVSEGCGDGAVRGFEGDWSVLSQPQAERQVNGE